MCYLCFEPSDVIELGSRAGKRRKFYDNRWLNSAVERDRVTWRGVLLVTLRGLGVGGTAMATLEALEPLET